MMKRGSISSGIPAALLLGLLALGCTPLDDIPGQPGADERTLVPVTLSLAVAPEEPATKGPFDPDEPGYDASTAIKTVTVLQFEKDAEGDGYTRIGNQICYDWTDIQAGTQKISLTTSARENILFVIANATGPGRETLRLPAGIALKDFLEKQNGNLLSSLDSTDGTGIWFCPSGTSDRYLRMSATVKLDEVAPNTTVGSDLAPLYLKRNCAKVVIKVKNTSPGSDRITLDAVQLRCVNQVYPYVTNIPAGLPVTFLDPYSAQDAHRSDLAEQEFPAAFNDSGEFQTYTFLVAPNLRGTAAVTVQGRKNELAPPGATHFCVYAHYGPSENHLTYTYYLGANLTSDFNLAPNKKYVYTVDINGKGDPSVDSRIEDADEIRFTVDANCYMLKPPSRAGATTTFFIPVRRTAVFWNVPGTNMGVYGAATTEYYELQENTTWEAFLVWNEVKDEDGCAVPDNELLTGSYENEDGAFVVPGQGFNPAGGANPFIRIKVTNGMTGNALVAIRKTSGATMNDILWSWHLWVTDYDPYVEMTPEAGKYLYNVPNGEIHRYADRAGVTLWASPDYADAFMMDRNVGATVSIPPYYDSSPARGFFYQRGRKDPFPYPQAASVVSADVASSWPEGDGVKYNVRYSVHNPQTFLSGYTRWTEFETSGTILGSQTAAWMDPKVDQHGADNCEAGKSIYDPCPYGWQVPAVNNVWSDYTNATKEVVAQSFGAYYYPGGIDPSAPNGRIFYPHTGIYYYGYRPGYVSGVGLTSFIQSANSAFQIYANVGGYPYSYMASAVPVRCIRLSYRHP